jgi:hypothetical protein
MNCPWRFIGEGGIRFFGKMSASTSHELKNVLAIVNENAGLLDDLTMLADRGSPVDPARLKKISLSIAAQVRRADIIIRNINRFAHSTDEKIKNINLQETLNLLLTLAGRLAANRGVILTPAAPETRPVFITTAPFPLQNLIWLSLEFAMNVAGTDKAVHLALEENEEFISVVFTRLNCFSGNQAESFPGNFEKALLSALGADLALDRHKGRLEIILPRNIKGSIFNPKEECYHV